MKLFITSIFIFISQIIVAQHAQPSVLKALRTDHKIKFDGVLNDSIWQQATHITNFTQRELNFGEPVTERTEVAVVYDKNNLYFGVWCYQKDASKIVAKFMNPDFDYESDDNFQIVISPFNDNRTGYFFAINPNVARTDILVSGGEDGNEDWNGVWDAKTTITNSGWFAEIIIPFNTLQFKKEKVLDWALNFERDIASKNEQALWQGWSRDNSIFSVVKAGRLAGLENISYAKRFELKPYLLAGRHFDTQDGSSCPLKLGGNLNINLSPTLKLNLTTFTDFAQVEADKIPVNLSRFGVYYPEKRQFFLEGYDLYDFYLGDRNRTFYTREIGLENGKPVPIIAGTRLFGKIGRNNIGFLNIQEAAIDSIPTTNNTVFRYKHDMGKQSYIGGIFTNVINANHSNQVLGIDVNYQSANFLKDKNIAIRAELSTSFENFKQTKNALTYRLSVDYPNDLIDNFMAIGSMQRNFNPELGYIYRSNYKSYSWYFRIMPRWFTSYGVKRLSLKPWGFTLYRTNTTGELESFRNESRPLGAVFKSGERFEVNFIQNYDRIDSSFNLTDEISIPVGKYWMFNYELQFETYQARKIWTFLLYNWGGFYTGSIKTFEVGVGLNVNKHLNITGKYSGNWVDLPQGNVFTNEITSNLNYAFTTKLNFSLFA